MWHEYFNVTDINSVLEVLAQEGEKARIVAGATDLLLEIERGARKGIETLIDITRVVDLDRITLIEDELHLGSMVTHNQCVDSALVRDRALPLALAAWNVGSPQIRNRGTIAGNLITASPANDAISPLMALNAKVKLISLSNGERTVPLNDFYRGVRQTVMQPDEMLVDIIFPAMKENQRGIFLKHALRRAQAISVINVAIILTLHEDMVSDAAVTLGAVAPTIIHATEAEEYIIGKKLTRECIEKAALLAMKASKPISDLRSSKDYREEIVRVITRRGLEAIAQNIASEGLPQAPALLWGKGGGRKQGIKSSYQINGKNPIKTTINGKKYVFNNGHDKTLLRLIREDALLTGTKEGCAEGECGACTLYLDGVAVMSCMVPAPRADGAEIITIEGLADGDNLHPVQEAFIEEGAVQCGYCTPGFIMSAAKLLEENPNPDTEQVKQSITGNLCRCTGYYKIIKAIEKAATSKQAMGY